MGCRCCPGAEAEGQAWTPVEPSDDAITCNIGDMLMRWSDDVLPSNFHRVKAPGPGDDLGARYCIAFFAQANRGVVIESPAGSYPPITAGDFILERIRANYGGYGGGSARQRAAGPAVGGAHVLQPPAGGVRAGRPRR